MMNGGKIKLVVGIHWNGYSFLLDTAYWTLRRPGSGLVSLSRTHCQNTCCKKFTMQWISCADSCTLCDMLSEKNTKPCIFKKWPFIHPYITSSENEHFPPSDFLWKLLTLIRVKILLIEWINLALKRHVFIILRTDFCLPHSMFPSCTFFFFSGAASLSVSLSQLLQMFQGSKASFNEPYPEFWKII